MQRHHKKMHPRAFVMLIVLMIVAIMTVILLTQLGSAPSNIASSVRVDEEMKARMKLTRLGGHLSMRNKGDHEGRNEVQEDAAEQVHG